ncbi:Asp-tRNA(Asn)/Glu-tRNA(Gln) amidotransferase GatCAB subunit A [Alicyclobacillus macrosporangiidus]|uniref:Aspartyl-tRNA(Asn)/glutamyl-tRNA(Gln) amidotransferase subunit A n=1 Tax=Alicyclobacillus macrosporangiidus TaxID=392015 RepID=A0A1I7H7N2_9BACL|nr:Asp-tRNA(Asn)/Glu-tRNA(Gln) amidotransferase GatCAB subunit A [Alicyclobacillus macrosporangiidus]SFU56649.1 aspartyl-tRNA(Asn)/glutamyl-tRNA(Gln) amidotransferase subunit A [Alicyclobacillus macrosporangiidus]
MNPHLWTISEYQQHLAKRDISAEEAVRDTLARIRQFDPALHAYIHVSETAVEEARQIDERLAQGLPVGPLAGVPVAVKDLIDTEDMPTTYGGLHFAGRRPSRTATAVARLRAAGAIVIGKTNLHEYAYGTTNENPHYGRARNPWNRAKIPGGSSGGSGVAIAAGLAMAALGTDTGGSVRIPAALCGHVGLKPTYGLVSKAGVFPLADSLDHVGPMARSVLDAALLLSVLAGPDPRDPTTVRIPPRAYHQVQPKARARVGVPKSFFFDKCHAGVAQTVQAALRTLQEHGFDLVEVDLPNAHQVPEMQNAIISSEALDVHEALLKAHPEQYGEDVRKRLESGYEIRGHQVVTATRFRRQFATEMQQVFAQVDVIATPATPITATDVGQQKAHIRAQEVLVRAHLTRYTNPWNLTGLPAITLPCGLAPDGLPVGLQLVGPRFGEMKLLAVALAAESALPWNPVAPDYR